MTAGRGVSTHEIPQQQEDGVMEGRVQLGCELPPAAADKMREPGTKTSKAADLQQLDDARKALPGARPWCRREAIKAIR